MGKLGPFSENTIVVGDCLDIMAQMPDGCVDLVVTDPPYAAIMGTAEGFRDNYSTLRFLADGLYREFRRLLKQDGMVYLFTDWRSYPAFWYGSLQYLKPAQLVVWAHNSARRFSQHRFCHQLIFVSAGEAWKPLCPSGHDYDIWEEPNIRASERLHPTQKPSVLVARAIESASEEGDMVTDFFVGSGTTCIEADRLGRKFFGCDINPDCVEMALERLEKDRAGRQLQLI